MKLKRLAPQFRTLVTTDFLAGRAPIGTSLETHIKEFKGSGGRTPDLEPLVNIMNKAMEKFSETKREESDRWLAPRVHATLRLTRREAGDAGVWSYLAMSVLDDYVRWRWKGAHGDVAA